MSGQQNQDFYYETRFAVVMYGGISLAIYINGVAQELYRMVRATARKADGSYLEPDESKLDESERVYRKIGKELRTKFVVDILSGTSAGGLNAIFLAKALANNQKFSKLAEVWKNVADVNTLIYDRESAKGLPVRLDVPEMPPYLMNSQRMAYLLYKAFEDMDEDPAEKSSSFADELDLYVTATDLYGRNIKLRTTNPDSSPQEKRFRKVFHLRYAKGSDRPNDFTKADNPFLAFISRCTSAIPPAFESMTLNDMLNLPGVTVSDDRLEEWKKYFDDTAKDAHLDLPFADGGYLDNKPFSYATESLLNRTADHPVDRKLIYIEPSPQKLSAETISGAKPNVIENVTKATVTLPMYEPIRDDLEAVHRRNRTIERAQQTLREVEERLLLVDPSNIRTISKSRWSKLTLQECIEQMGPPYAAYLALRVKAIVDGIVTNIAESHNLDRQSQGFFEMNNTVWGWFDKHYSPKKESGKKVWNEFLYKTDIDWRIRRLNFLHGKIDEFLVLENILNSEPEALNYLGFAEKKLFLDWVDLKEKVEKAKDPKNVMREGIHEYAAGLLIQSIQKRVGDLYRERSLPQRKEQKKYIENLYGWLEEAFRISKVSGDSDPQLEKAKIRNLLKDDKFLSSFVDALRQIKTQLNSRQNDLYDSRSNSKKDAKKNITNCGDENQITKYVEGFIKNSDLALRTPDDISKKALGSDWDSFSSKNGSLPDALAMLYLQTYFESFEYYDRLTYPIIVANDLGEADVVDIWRVSPEDSRVFDSDSDKFKQKLGGQTLVNFGAFFKKEWRENDIMWGRLDGAEQIIRSLDLSADKQDVYIQTAQAAILRNEVSQKNNSLIQILRQDSQYKTARWKIWQKAGTAPVNKSQPGMTGIYSAIATIMPVRFDDDSIDDGAIISQVDDESVLGAFKKEFKLDLSLEPGNALQLAARSAQVAGKMFEGLSIEYSLNNKGLANWITRLGQFLFWVVEVATTDSLFSMIARNIFFLLYFTGLVFIAAGSLSPDSKFPSWGWGIIGFTAFFQYARSVMKNILVEKSLFDLKKPPAQESKTKDEQPKRRPFWKVLVPSSLANPALIPLLGGLILLVVTNYAADLMKFLLYMKEIFFVIGAILIAFGLFIALIYGIGNRITKWLARPVWILLILSLITAASILAMGWSVAPLKAAGHTIIEFELANQAGKSAILNAWSGKESYVWWTLFLDFPFLLGVTTFLWILWDLFGKKFQTLDKGIKIAGLCGFFASLTILAGLADFLENIAFMGILSGYAGDFLMPMGVYSTYIKFGLFAVSLVLLPVMAIWLWIINSKQRVE